MKTQVMFTSKYLHNDLVIILLCMASFVIWIVTLNDFAIYYFPPDALYYAKSLPITYWIGISVTIITIVTSLFSSKTKSTVKLIPQIILVLYLHVLPSVAYEGYRYSDIYTHGSGVLRIMHFDNLPSLGYSAQYPQSFISMAQFVEIVGIDPFIPLKFYEILTILLLMALTYVTAKQIIPKYAPIASLAVISLFWIDQGHFSPQATALVFYLILWLNIMKILDTKQISRPQMVLIAISLITLNLSSPTNSIFLLVNLAAIVLIYVIRSLFRRPYDRTVAKKISYILLLHVIIWMTWSTQMAESRGLIEPADKITTALQAITSSGLDNHKVAVPHSPEYSYLIVNIMQYATSIVLWGSGLCIVLLLHKKYKTKSDTTLILLSGWFISALCLLPVTLFIQATFVERVYMYTIFPFALLMVLFMLRSGIERKNMIVTTFLIMFILTSAFVIPLSKYGQDPNYYFPSSTLYLSDLLTKISEDDKVVALTAVRSSFYYFNAINDAKIKINPLYRQVTETNDELVSKSLKKPYDYAVSSEALNNSIILRRNVDYLPTAENYMKDDNLIINTGDARAYMYRMR